MASTLPHALHSRRRHTARRRATPFNLKDAGRCPAPRLQPTSGGSSTCSSAPWVDVSCSTDPYRPINRISNYAVNAASLWVATPNFGLYERQTGSWLSQVLRGLTGLVGLKLRFKGKSFRWHRKKGTLVLRFGHSHLVRCAPPLNTRWKRSGKTKLVFFNSNLPLLRSYLTDVVSWREPNRYHSRGLRLARQRITRKAGKVSAYR